MATCSATFRVTTRTRPNGTSYTTWDWGHKPCGAEATHTKDVQAATHAYTVPVYSCAEHAGPDYQPIS